MLKHVVLVLSVVSVCAVSSQGAVVLSQNFDNLPLGPVTTATQDWAGDPQTTGGAWRFHGGTSGEAYPAVSNGAAYSGTQSYLIARGSGVGKASVGWTSSLAGNPDDDSANTVGVRAGQTFDFSAYVNPISYGDGTEGGWTMNPNSYDYCQSYCPVCFNIYTYGGELLVYGRTSSGSETWLDTGKAIAAGKWTGVKLSVTQWDNGSGIGSYNAYVDTGAGFTLAKANITFNSNELYDYVNAVEIDPSDRDGMLCGYIDNVSIVTTPEPITISILGLGALFAARRRA
jgi:hypothetical protein